MKFPLAVGLPPTYTGRPQVVSEILIFTGLAGMFAVPLKFFYGLGGLQVLFWSFFCLKL